LGQYNLSFKQPVCNFYLSARLVDEPVGARLLLTGARRAGVRPLSAAGALGVHGDVARGEPRAALTRHAHHAPRLPPRAAQHAALRGCEGRATRHCDGQQPSRIMAVL
jgi:hypothetical protein